MKSYWIERGLQWEEGGLMVGVSLLLSSYFTLTRQCVGKSWVGRQELMKFHIIVQKGVSDLVVRVHTGELV